MADILFKSALGYWDEALKKLFPIEDNPEKKGNKKIKWDIDFNLFERDSCPELESNGKLKVESNFPPDKYLYIYVAPLTWASRYYKNQFEILGPAFGTNNSLSVFAGRYLYKKEEKNENDIIVNVGTIGKYITSSALFLVYHLFMKYIFNTDIHLLSTEQKIIEKIKQKSINITFNFINEPHRSKRLDRLEKEDGDIDYAIFTIEDIIKLNLYDNSIREILKVDPILSHIFNIEYVPRAVYCIHKSQKHMKKELELFNEYIVAKRNLFNKKMELGSKEKTVYPINPNNTHARNTQNLIIDYYKKMLMFDHDNIPEYMIDKFEKLEFTNLIDLIT